MEVRLPGSKTKESHAPWERSAGNHSAGMAHGGKQVIQVQPLNGRERIKI